MSACANGFDGSCIDLTDSALPSKAGAWLVQRHGFALGATVVYIALKLAMRLILGVVLGAKLS